MTCLSRGRRSVVNVGQVDRTRSGPIRIKPAQPDVTMKTRPRPRLGPIDVSVLDRIKVNVITIPIVFDFVPNPVFPIAGLPDASALLRPLLFGHIPIATALR